MSSAITRIEVLTDSGRSKQTFTHFISIPANQDVIQEGFTEFKRDVSDMVGLCLLTYIR